MPSPSPSPSPHSHSHHYHHRQPITHYHIAAGAIVHPGAIVQVFGNATLSLVSLFFGPPALPPFLPKIRFWFCGVRLGGVFLISSRMALGGEKRTLFFKLQSLSLSKLWFFVCFLIFTQSRHLSSAATTPLKTDGEPVTSLSMIDHDYDEDYLPSPKTGGGDDDGSTRSSRNIDDDDDEPQSSDQSDMLETIDDDGPLHSTPKILSKKAERAGRKAEKKERKREQRNGESRASC